MKISIENIRNGIKNTKWPYRLQSISVGKIFDLLPSRSQLYIDGAHNISGAYVISEFLKSEKQKDGIKNYIINGRTKDTDSEGFLSQFKNSVEMICAIRVKMEVLAESPYKIKESAEKINLHCIVCHSITDAIKKIICYENNGEYSDNIDFNRLKTPVRICICGSFYLARDFKIENN